MSDEFDGSNGGDRAQPDDAAKRAAKQTGKITVLRMRKVLQPKIAAALRALADAGPFSQQQSVDAMRAVLREVNLNDYKDEFAQRIASVEVHVRHSHFGKAVQFLAHSQFDMFTEELAENVLLPAGEGLHVSLARATWSHILRKMEEQRINAEEAAATHQRTDAAFEVHRAAMEPNPTLEFREVMYRTGRWQRRAAA